MLPSTYRSWGERAWGQRGWGGGWAPGDHPGKGQMTKVLGCQVTPRHITPSRGRRAASVPSRLKRRGGKETNSHSCRRGTAVISGEGLSSGSPGGTAHRRTTAAAFLRNPLRKVKTRTGQPREELIGRQQYRVRHGTPGNGQASTWQQVSEARPPAGKRAWWSPRTPSVLLSQNPPFL